MTKKVLFVCVENAGRSQIAESFFRKYGGDSFHVTSAGTTPSSQLNPIVIQVIDVTQQSPKLLSDDMINNSKTVNMGCMDKESCPALFVNDVIDWNIDDPKGQSIEQVRIIRDEIKLKVLKLIDSLKDEK